MAAWFGSDGFIALYNKFGSTSQSTIGTAGNRDSAKMYELLLGNAPVSGSGDNMGQLDGLDNVAWNSGPTFSSGTGGSIEIDGTLDGNGSSAFYNFQVINKVIFGTTPPTETDWTNESVPGSTEGNTFGETGWIETGDGAFVLSGGDVADWTIDGLVNGEEYYVHVLYYNGFNSLDVNEWSEVFDPNTTVTTSTVILEIPQISTFVYDTLNNEFDASWTANGNATTEFDSYSVTIENLTGGGSQSFSYSNTTTSVTDESITNFFPSPGDTIQMSIQAIDDKNTNSGTDTLTDTA